MYSWGQKLESPQKFMQLRLMQANFGGHGLSGFRKIAPFCMPSKQPIFPFRQWTIVHESQKLESAQVTCSLLNYLRCTTFSKMNAEIFRLAILVFALGLFSTCIIHCNSLVTRVAGE